MKRLPRRLLVIAVVAALSVLGTGCNAQWSSYAARVNSNVITPAQLDNALKDASSNAEFRCLLEKSSTSGYRLEGAGSDTYDSAFVAFMLTQLIQAQVAHSVVEAAHLAEPASARTMAETQVEAGFSEELSSSGCGGATAQILQQLGSALSSSIVQLRLDEDALAAHAAHGNLTPASISAYETSHPTVTKQSCLSGLFLKTKATGTTVEKLLQGGASFSSVFAKYSDGATGNGALGCYTNGDLTSISSALEKAVAPAHIGESVGPITYESAYIVLRVTSRPFEPEVDALSQILASYSGSFSSAIIAGVRHASIQLNPQYGTWTTKVTSSNSSAAAGLGGLVVPPSGPPAKFLLNRKAVEGMLQKAPASSTGSSGG